MNTKVYQKNSFILEHSSTILWIESRSVSRIVIGAPHHAPGGIKQLPCSEHQDSDENTGIIADLIAELGGFSSVIACNYRVDPNKNLNTDYSKQIISWKPAYLIEIHGHGAKKISDKTIEISSGSIERNTWSLKFSQTLKSKMTNSDILRLYEVKGDFSSLYFKGTKSETITYPNWTPFHIELPPSLRIDKNNKPPRATLDLVKAINETILEVCV